jgi:uncharacterized protein YecE (DUF72 family)
VTNLRIGISGWSYPPWRGTFFPPGLPQKQELAFASRQINSIELNGTFYSLQRPTSFQKWYEQTPDGFLFSVKGPRFITHLKRLKNIEAPLANFFASGVLRLNEKLGPMLWQLPPNFPFDPARLADFFQALPRDTIQAAKLAKLHDSKLRERAWKTIDTNRPLRHVLEVRHVSFVDSDFISLLRKHQIGLVIAETAGKWPFFEDLTSDLVYVRLHGDTELYVSGYTPASLEAWAKKIGAWAEGRNPAGAKVHTALEEPRPAGRDVFVYFDNDVKTRAPYDAMALAHFLKIGPKPGEAPAVESISESPRTHWPAFRKTKQRVAAESPPRA